MRDYITMEVYEPRTNTRSITSQTQFTFCPDRPAHWLQRACLWVLGKLGCNVIDKVLSTTMVRVDEAALLDNVLDQMTSIRRNDQEPEMVVLGDAQYSELRYSMEYTSQYMGRAHVGRDVWPPLYGVPIRIVPWFRGALVIPKIQ